MISPDTARQLGRAHRQSLSPAYRAWANRLIQQQTRQLVGRVATYWALPEEADPGRLPGQYLPVIEGSSLRFAQYQSDQTCASGALGIPVPTDVESVSVAMMDWVLVPLSAFDARGVRVGMGGGYYDQTLGQVPRVRRIGVAYSGQQLAGIRPMSWDQPLGGVITPRGWFGF